PRFTHLVFLKEQPAVRVKRMRYRQSRCHEERRPIDRMEPEYLLADDLKVGGPQAIKFGLVGLTVADAAQVPRQRVKPHVKYVLLPSVGRQRDAPFERRAAD